MKYTINEKYLEIPVNPHSTKKKILFYNISTGTRELVFEIDTTVDSAEPEYFQYVNMERFNGCAMELLCDPAIDIKFNLTDEMRPEKRAVYEKYRPQVHFSAKRGWINDPNGLYYENGVYHMFFQHNPASRDWGNMHWGHAVSTDLVNWEQKECALYPDEMGTMFSGSAIIDKKNVTGLKTNENEVVLLYYTAAANNSIRSKGKKFTQCMAYSTDGGNTFVKYDKNPVVDFIEAENRDPKVIYSKELDAYIMALFLDGNRYNLFKSDNLIDWKLMQALALPEDAECPDIYPLPTDGTGNKDENGVKWIFSGASDRYFVGEIKDGEYKVMQDAKRLHYGANSYAAQTFSGIEDGRTIRVAWDTMHIPNTYFNCSMCFPTEMSLKNINGEDFLCTMPVREIAKLYKTSEEYNNVEVKEGAKSEISLDTDVYKAYDVEMVIKSKNDSIFKLKMLGTEMVVDVRENQIKVRDKSMPVCIKGDEINLRIIADKNGFEIFAGYGEAFMCMGCLCDYSLKKFEIISEKSDIVVVSNNVRGM